MGHFIDSGGGVTGGSEQAASLSTNGLRIDRVRRAPTFESESQGLSYYQNVPAFGLLQHAAEKLPDRDAIRYDDDVWSYSELNDAAVQCAAMLQSLGVKPGERVGVLLPNVPEYVIACNGIWRSGAIAVAISPLMVQEEVEALLRKTNCRRVICLDVLSHLCSGDLDLIDNLLLVSIRKHLPAHKQLGYLWIRHRHTSQLTIGSDERCGWFWETMESVNKRWQPITIDPLRDPAYILPTGGTTGDPKAVTLSHTNMVANAWQQYSWTGETFGSETMMAVLPFFHSYGLSTTVMAGAAMGATLVLHHRYNTRQTIRLIEKHRPTVLHAVPAMLVAMNERLRNRPADLSSIDWVISGGAPLDETVGQEFAEHSGALVVEGYGLSEASPVTHVGHLFRDARFGVIGLPLPHTECRIVDTHNGQHEVVEGEVGELIIRGPQVMLGYWKDQAATKDAVRDGWLHTGDLAVRHPDGYYSIVGRKKDLIITSGYNVYPREVEDAIRQCPIVEDVAVIGVPDPRRGELVKAVIVLKSGETWDEDVLEDHCCQILSKHKRPRIFERCTGELPKNFLGKVVRRHLRDADSTSDTVHAGGPTDSTMESKEEVEQ